MVTGRAGAWSLAAALALSVQGCALFGAEDARTHADGAGHRVETAAPASMRRSQCPDYRRSASAVYDYETLAYRHALEAEVAVCGAVDPRAIGLWAVAEETLPGDVYSLAAVTEAVSRRPAAPDGASPALMLTCLVWPDGATGTGVSLLGVTPPALQAGRADSMRFEFGASIEDPDLDVDRVGIVSGTVELPPQAARGFVERLRLAVAAHGPGPGPLLTVAIPAEGDHRDADDGQVAVAFDLDGADRAALAVVEACEPRPG